VYVLLLLVYGLREMVAEGLKSVMRQEVRDGQEKFAIRRQVRMTSDDDRFLRERARVTGISPSWQIRDALRVYRSLYLPSIAGKSSIVATEASTEESE
jgi:hypothetical protein